MFVFNNEKFSGPLGLLLSLIEKEELDITEISLAKIADEYVSYIKDNEDIEAEEVADFLLIAAKLLHIKSKALLPYLYSKDDEEEIDDLEQQLKMYKEFVEASVKIKDLLLEDKKLYLPVFNKKFRQQNCPAFSAPKKMSVNVLHEKYQDLLQTLEAELIKRDKEKIPEESLEPKISIEDKIFSIKKLLQEKIKLSFSKILTQSKNKSDVIVSFLAVLELAKQKELYFEQGDLFSEIFINLNTSDNDDLNEDNTSN